MNDKGNQEEVDRRNDQSTISQEKDWQPGVAMQHLVKEFQGHNTNQAQYKSGIMFSQHREVLTPQ